MLLQLLLLQLLDLPKPIFIGTSGGSNFAKHYTTLMAQNLQISTVYNISMYNSYN